MLYDVETRKLIAREHAELLRAQAEKHPSRQRARLWLSDHLIAAGTRIAPECAPQHRPLRAV